jgi:Glycosyl hydrolases family 15
MTAPQSSGAEATAVFPLRSYLGMLAEEVDPVTGEPLGNFPQAFSHIGLLNATWAISEAEDCGHTKRMSASDGCF